MSDFLDDRRREITDRLKELEPLVDEFHRLEAAATALAGAIGSAASGAGSAAVATITRRRGPGRSRGSSTGKKGPGRPRGSSNRASTAPSSVPAAGTPSTAERKKPGRPKGSGKKVGRPKGSGKKVGRPPGSGKKVGRPAGKVGRPTGKVGRRKGSGARALEALSLVQGQPGVTIPELAAKMGITATYLYRVLPGLQQEGKLEKKGRGWYPKAA